MSLSNSRSEDKPTFEKTKQKLINLGIPEAQIKIKTADIIELKGLNLLSRNYPVHLFMDPLQSVVKALNRAGFSDKDYRDLTPQQALQTQSSPETADVFGAFNNPSNQISPPLPENYQSNQPADLDPINKPWGFISDTEISNSSEALRNVSFVEHVTQQAIAQNKAYEAAAEEAVNVDMPAALEDKMNKHTMKVIFKDHALSLKLPQFFIQIKTGGWFDDEDAVQLFEQDLLLKDFRLSQADATISFEDVETEMYRVDLEQIGDKNYQTMPFKVGVMTEKSLMH